jgi:TolB protein
MDADGRNQTRLTEGGWPDSQPDWSADGSRIVLVSLRFYAPDIFIMNADGTGQANLMNSRTASPGFCCPDLRPSPTR